MIVKCALQPYRPGSSDWRRFTSRAQRGPSEAPLHLANEQTVQKRSETEINGDLQAKRPCHALLSSLNFFQRNASSS
jgi:hypothetical protein